MSSEEIKEKIIEDINKLPKNSLKEIMDFVMFKLSETVNSERDMENHTRLDPSKDPLLKFIGSIQDGSLAKDIDKDLYGEAY